MIFIAVILVSVATILFASSMRKRHGREYGVGSAIRNTLGISFFSCFILLGLGTAILSDALMVDIDPTLLVSASMGTFMFLIFLVYSRLRASSV